MGNMYYINYIYCIYKIYTELSVEHAAVAVGDIYSADIQNIQLEVSYEYIIGQVYSV